MGFLLERVAESRRGADWFPKKGWEFSSSPIGSESVRVDAEMEGVRIGLVSNIEINVFTCRLL